MASFLPIRSIFCAQEESIDLNIAVIGGSGFIGTRLVKRLLDSNHNVTIIDKARSKEHPNLWKKADVRDLESLRRTIDPSHHVIYNLAAEHRDDVRPKKLYDEVNVDGAKNLCAIATEKGIPSIVFTSSVAVYGFAAPDTDETGTISYFNDYGRTKWLAEEVYRNWHNEDRSSRNLCVVRPTVVFGEGNRGNVYNLMNQIVKNRFIMVGNGKNKKSMAYVENVAAFLEYCLGLRGYHLYNYVDKPDYDMNTLVHEVRRVLGKNDTPIPKIPYFLGVISGYAFDLVSLFSKKPPVISSMRIRKFCSISSFDQTIPKVLFDPVFSLRDGLKRTILYDFHSENGHKNDS